MTVTLVGGASLLCAIALAGCSTGMHAGDASTDSGGSDTGASSSTYQQDLAAWNKKFQVCMKSAGIDLPDAAPGQMLDLASLGIDPAKYQKASGVCSTKVGPAPIDKSIPSANDQYQMSLKFARCMRSHGYDWADPAPPSNSSADEGGAPPIDPSKYDMKVYNACAASSGLPTGASNG